MTDAEYIKTARRIYEEIKKVDFVESPAVIQVKGGAFVSCIVAFEDGTTGGVWVRIADDWVEDET